MRYLLKVVCLSLILISCDKEFNNIGADLVGEDHFEVIKHEASTVGTENFKLAGVHPVQTDNLPYNLLGYYNDPVFGSTNANILSQVALSEYGRDFGDHPVITKVVFSMPYFSRKTSTDSEGAGTYELDSVYGNGLVKMSLYKSEYFLNDFDSSTNFEERQDYYSNDDVLFAPHSFDNPSNLIFVEDDLEISSDEISLNYVDEDGNDVIERLSPRVRVELTNPADITPFNWLIDEVNQASLTSESEFKDLFRGYYVKVEPVVASPTEGTLFGVDLSQAEIEVTYGELLFEADGITPLNADGDSFQDYEDNKGTIKILFQGNNVNTFTDDIVYTEDPDKMYLRGGQGAMVKIDLFNPNSDDDRNSLELSDIRDQAEEWIINEANIEFYVDENPALTGQVEPERIFLYDVENNRVLDDYLGDEGSSNSPLVSKSSHLGRLQRDASGKGVKYKIKITEHIKNVIKKDSLNIKLGLVVSNNVNLLGVSDIKDVTSPNSILSSSITAHQGTVLYNENAVESKKVKLNIHYTKLN